VSLLFTCIRAGEAYATTSSSPTRALLRESARHAGLAIRLPGHGSFTVLELCERRVTCRLTLRTEIVPF
jgi:hypothetical protein